MNDYNFNELITKLKDIVVEHEKETEKNDIIFHQCFSHSSRIMAYILEINYSYTEIIFSKENAAMVLTERLKYAMDHQAKLIDLLRMHETFPWEDMKYELESGFNPNNMYEAALRHYRFDAKTFTDLNWYSPKIPKEVPWTFYQLLSTPIIKFIDNDKLQLMCLYGPYHISGVIRCDYPADEKKDKETE
jgi:hypothetical protein